MRSVVLGRNNWLFTGGVRGGHAAAVLYSLTQSAKRNGLDPFAYLRDLLQRIPTHPQSRITDHRIGFTSHNLTGMLDGDLDDIFDELATQHEADRLAVAGLNN